MCGIVVHVLGGNDLARRDTLLDPLDERGKRIKGIRSWAAGAMAHSGDREETREGLLLRKRQALLSHHSFVVIDRVLGRYDGIGETMIEN